MVGKNILYGWHKKLYTIKCNKKGDAYTFFIFFIKKNPRFFPCMCFILLKIQRNSKVKQAETNNTKKKNTAKKKSETQKKASYR